MVQFFRRYFEDGNEDAWFVVEDQGKPMGALALYRLSPGRWEAGRLAFDFAYRGLKGFRIAQRAVRLLQDYARAIGHGQMRCEVLEYNKTMLRIVESVGFVPVHSGERDGKRFFELVAPLGLRKSPPSESESGPL
jgi:RimJ/RimL family protein N-acetyltransferase